MTTQRIDLTNTRGEKLSARLELPLHGRAKSFAVVAHCFTCSKDLNALRTIARAMTHVGIGVVRFDFTGLGQSEGAFADTTFSSNVDDLVAAARQVEEAWGPVELLAGHSLGGAAAILAAEQLDGVKAVATIGAPSKPVHVRQHVEEAIEEIRREGEAVVEIVGRPFTVRQEFLDDLETTHLDDVLYNLGRPLLVMHAPRDEMVSIDHAAKIFEAARHPRSFVSLDGADHLLTDDDQAHYVGQLISSWARRYVSTESVEEWRADTETGRTAARTAKGLRTDVIAGGFPLVVDEPRERGGTDEGPKPHDFLSAGLAACMSITARMYADRKGWPMDEVTVHADYSRVDDGDEGPVERFDCRIRIDGDLDEEQRRRICKMATRCPVHRTLESQATVETILEE